MKLKTRFAALPILTLLMSCETSGPGIDSCAWTAPIYISREDVLTGETARQILAHNETGRRLCGWEHKGS